MNITCQNPRCGSFQQTVSGTPEFCPTCGTNVCLAPGVLLHGPSDQYTISREIGRGGMGGVCLATDITGSDVVVKQFFTNSQLTPADNDDNRKRFKREAEFQKMITHPSIPKGFGWWEQFSKLFMAMEFVPGQTWTKLIELSPGGRMDFLQACEIVIQIASALDYLHNLVDPASNTLLHLVHRDIKPDNVMVMANGQVKVLDLGIARPADLSKATVAQGTLVVGSTEYVPPEQLGVPGAGGKLLTFDGRADQYALAASLYHALTGQQLNDVRKTGWKVRYDLVRTNIQNTEIQGVIRKAISIDPDDRYPTAREFAMAVARAHEKVAPLPAHLQQFVHLQPATSVFSFSGTGLVFPTGPINLASTVATAYTSGGIAVPGPVVPAPTTPTFNPALVSIEVQRMSVNVISATEYERVIRGQVIYNGRGLPNFTVRPEITEIGGPKNGPGNDVKTGPGGDFILDMDDYRVPLTVQRREVLLLVLDQAGVAINNARLRVKIKRPRRYDRQARRQVAMTAGTYVPFGQRVANWVTWPFAQARNGLSAIWARVPARPALPKAGPNFVNQIGTVVTIVATIALWIIGASTAVVVTRPWVKNLWILTLGLAILFLLKATFFRNSEVKKPTVKGRPNLGRTISASLVIIHIITWLVANFAGGR